MGHSWPQYHILGLTVTVTIVTTQAPLLLHIMFYAILYCLRMHVKMVEL